MRVLARIPKGRLPRNAEFVEVPTSRSLTSIARPGDWVFVPASELGMREELPVVELFGLRVDGRGARVQDVLVPLAQSELRILYELVAARGAVVDRTELRGAIGCARSRHVDRLVSRLRRKLASFGFDVRSMRSVGYRLERRANENRVLVIEDDPDMRRAFVRVLQPLAVDFATSVAESLTLVTERRYAAVIVDLGLPDGCGSTVIPVLQKWDPPPQVMIVSARSDADALSLSGRFGVPYCTKPADPSFIRSFAARAIGLLN